MATRTRTESSIRPFRPGDRQRFLDLYERVWGRGRSRAWFDWRFGSNPLGDGVQMVVAERDGTLVGAEPLIPFRIRADGVEARAFQPADWIVDPDHRHQGVFTRMTERLLDMYSDDAALLFNFPSDALLPGLSKFDWRVVGTHPMAYRVDRPSTVLSERAEASRAANAVIRIGDAVGRPLLRVLDRMTRRRTGVSVERVRSVPPAVTDLYVRSRPDAFHVPRDDAYREWRFANPRWETHTSLARRAGRVVAAAVTAVEERADGLRTMRVLDVQPMTGRPGRASALAAIFDDLVRNLGDVDVVCAAAGSLPGALRRGFLRDDAVGVSRLSNETTQVVRPLATDGELEWQLAGRSLTDPENWALAPADQDVA